MLYLVAIIIRDNSFLMVRKKGKDIWTNLGGKPEGNETEEQTLLREIAEEIHSPAKIIRKLGDFEAPAAFDDALVRLSAYLVEPTGNIQLNDPELEECRFIPRNYKELGLKMPVSVEQQIIPFLIKEGILEW